MITRRHVLLPAAAAAAVLAGLLAAAPAAASLGSVPTAVSDYAAAADGLRAALDEFYGPDAAGQGIEFDDSTAVGRIDRVWVFTAGFAAGDDDVPPIELTNEWTTPVSIGEAATGLAVIGIDPAASAPDLFDFEADAGLAELFGAVADDAALVRDPERGAWFALAGETLTPIVPGTSGVDEPMPVADYRDVLGAAPTASGSTGSVSGVTIAVIVGSLVVIVAVLVLPLVRSRLVRARLQPADDSTNVH